MNTALNRTTVALLTNNSGGAVAQGDVVVIDTTSAAAFTATTTSGYASGLIGVVLEPNGIAAAAIGTVAIGGYVPKVNLSGSASLGDVMKTTTVAKQAVRHAAPIVLGDFGEVLGIGTSPAALLWGAPAGAAVSLGTAYQTLGTNAGATATEWGPLQNDWSGAITWTQGATISKTVAYAYWLRLGKLVFLTVAMTATSAGTAGSNIAVGGIPTAAQFANSSAFWGVGSGIFEKSGGNRYEIEVAPSSASTLLFFSSNVGPALGGSPAVTIAAGDLLSFQAMYLTS